MIEWKFTPDDVARIRFAFSPLFELVLSLVVLRAPASHSLHLPWVRATRPLLADLDLSELFALVPVRGATADFLHPAAGLATAGLRRRAPAGAGHAPRPGGRRAGRGARQAAERIRGDPEAAIGRLADALQAYWDIALAGHWPRIQALLAADVLWRSRRLAVGGTRALFEDLHETIAWHGGQLSAADPFGYSGSLSGEGLLLVPAVMTWPGVRKMIEPYQPMLAYPARAIGPLGDRRTTSPARPGRPDGQTRAAMLAALAEPSSTTALARRLAITPGAVSQHLSVLLDAGMVTRSRVGRSVLYLRTRSGDTLAAASR